MLPSARERLRSISRHPLSIILIAFLLLGLYYSLSIPIFETPDEPQHFFYVRELVEGHGLPVQVENAPGRWSQEGSQPPLYYVAGALATFWIDASDWRDFSGRNPYAVQGDPLALGNRNVFIHTQREDFPWHGTALAVHLLRWLSLIFGALSLVFTYRAARVLFPAQPTIAAGAAALQAFIPQFIFVSAAVSNDALAACVGAATLWQAVRVARGAEGVRQYVWLGVLVGLAALTKLSGAGFALLAVAALLLGVAAGARSRGALVRAVIRNGLGMGLAAAAVAGWWYARNLALYGDVTGLNRMLAIVGQHQPPLDWWQVLSDTEGLRLSFWGVFGWFSILLPNSYYDVYDLLTVLALAGLFATLVQALVRSRPQRLRTLVSPLWLPPLAFAIILLGVLRWGSITPGLAGRLLFPALSAAALLLSAGLASLLPAGLQRAGLAVVAGALFALALGVPAVAIEPNYARPVVIAASSARPLVRFGDQIELMDVAAPKTDVHPGDEVAFSLMWRGVRPMSTDYTLWIKLFGENDELLGAIDTYPGFGMYPTSQWQSDQVVVDRYRLRVSEVAHVPTLAKLAVGFYERSTTAALLPTGADGARIVRPLAARIKILPPLQTAFAPAHPLDANFGDQISLRGYDQSATGLTFYWQTLNPPTDVYTVFVHALDADGKLIAQADGQPRNGDYPTSAWERGEWIADTHPLQLPPQTARLEIGLYVLATGARLPLVPQGGASLLVDLRQ